MSLWRQSFYIGVAQIFDVACHQYPKLVTKTFDLPCAFLIPFEDWTVKMPEKSLISFISARNHHVQCKLNAGFRHDPF